MNKFFALLSAPFIGVMIWLPYISPSSAQDVITPNTSNAAEIHTKLDSQISKTKAIVEMMKEENATWRQINDDLWAVSDRLKSNNAAILSYSQAIQISVAQATSLAAQIIESKFGTLIDSSSTIKSSMYLYKFSDSNYFGYALTIHPKSTSAISMVLGNDSFGGSETTLNAVNRYGAVAGVNAGGFADGDGKRYPLFNTFMDGSFISGFYNDQTVEKNVTFIGFDQNLHLFGGIFATQEDALSHDPKFGASFVPILLKDGKKITIPSPWNSSPYRAPRTVVASLPGGGTIFIVTDGYNEAGKSGATLAELQSKLQDLGAIDAFNLDGGGSSSLIFKGKIINNPSDGSLRSLPTHFLMY